jgi:hypothetical protein
LGVPSATATHKWHSVGLFAAIFFGKPTNANKKGFPLPSLTQPSIAIWAAKLNSDVTVEVWR